MNWNDLIGDFRRKRSTLEESEDASAWEALFQSSRPHFPSVKTQLLQYLHRLESGGADTTTDNRKEDTKTLVKDTRNALRFGLSCLSIRSDNVRIEAQDEALRCDWDHCLLQILGHNRGDHKCRLFAAQVLCNLVTSNSNSARVVSSKTLLAPSNESISSMLLQESFSDCQRQTTPPRESNWVDMMLNAVKTDHREALGTVVAALYNCMISQCSDSASGCAFIEQVSECSLLICTLLRQVVSVNSIKSNFHGVQEGNLTDAATEWIVLLFIKLCRRGMLPKVYQAAGGKAAPGEKVFPEQVVLLHCLRSELEHPTASSTALSSFGQCGVLGCEASTESTVGTHLFLARIGATLLQKQQIEQTSSGSDNTSYINEQELEQSATMAILDILVETLAEENQVAALVRQTVGKESSLIPQLCRELGRLYDLLSLRNNGRKSRDVLIRDDEQVLLTVLVRVLGNLAFGCQYNQDLLRTTLVPSSNSPERTGLHLLLSCTSFSHACFTLREWAVVAIRNVLQENMANQQVVAQLQAQQAIQSTELHDMGIRVDLKQHGRVTVTPLEPVHEAEPPQEGNDESN